MIDKFIQLYVFICLLDFKLKIISCIIYFKINYYIIILTKINLLLNILESYISYIKPIEIN
jgi:hypothetical protein